MENLTLVWITDPDAPYHLTAETQPQKTFKTLCGKTAWFYFNGDNTQTNLASCARCIKSAHSK